MSTDTLVAQLDARGERWDLYRGAATNADGVHAWIVQLSDHQSPRHRTVQAETLTGALRAAVDSVPLPLIPRRPMLSVWEIRKDGSKWRVYAGAASVGLFDRKRDAVTAMGKAETREAAARDEWDDRWSDHVATHTEGVDFYWTNR